MDFLATNHWNLTSDRLEPTNEIFWSWNALGVLTLLMNWASMALIRYGTPRSIFRPYGVLLVDVQICFMLSDFSMNIIRPILRDDQLGPSGRLAKIFYITGDHSFMPLFTALITNFLCAGSVSFLYLAIASRRHVEQGIRVILFVLTYHLVLSAPMCALAYFIDTRSMIIALVIFGFSQILLWTTCVFYTFTTKRKIFNVETKDGECVDFASIATRLYAQITLPFLVLGMGYLAVLMDRDWLPWWAMLCGARTHVNLLQMILFHRCYSRALLRFIKHLKQKFSAAK